MKIVTTAFVLGLMSTAALASIGVTVKETKIQYSTETA
jgi:hypothetical protein